MMKEFEKGHDFEDDRTLIVCKERQSIITFHNITKETVEKIRVDGRLISDNTVKKCDYLLLCAKIKKAILVELKGNKVKAAIEQLSATLNNETIKTPLTQYKKKAYAVVAGDPLLARYQKVQDQFSKRHGGCTLKVVRSPYACELLSGRPVT
jgi:hypothetical protein